MAGASMTLMACYGGPDIEVEGTFCYADVELSSTLPAHLDDVAESNGRYFGDSSCREALGYQAEVAFKAPEAGEYEIRVTSQERGVVSVRLTDLTDDGRCDSEAICEEFPSGTGSTGTGGSGNGGVGSGGANSAGGAGGVGPDVDGGGAPGADPGAGGEGGAAATNEPLRIELAKGDTITIVVSGLTEEKRFVYALDVDLVD